MADYNKILATMTGQFEELAGFSPDAASDVGIRMKVLAAQIFSLQTELEALREGLFPATARGERLDMHAAARGLQRKPALPSSGVLRFYRQTTAAHDILIPAGTTCQTAEGGVQVETTCDVLLPAGQLQAEGAARSLLKGENANVAARRITVFSTAPQGVYGVTNPAPFTGGQEAEGDDALRARLLASYATIANGTNAAFYREQALGHEFVYSAAVIPRARGIGTVDVVVAGRGSVLSQQQLDAVERELQEQKEICTDVAVRSPSVLQTEILVELDAKDEYGFEQTAAEVVRYISAHLASLHIGQPLLYSRLCAGICGIDGVHNHTLRSPAADIYPAVDQLIVQATVAVTQMNKQVS